MKPRGRRALLLAFAGLALAALPAAELPAPEPPDVPWKIYQTTAAAFPPRLMQNGVTHGDARIRVSLDAGGQLLDALLVACSHRDFGDEALRVIRVWRFEAERVNGESVGVVADVIFEFRLSGVLAVTKRSPAPDEEKYAPVDPLAYRAENLRRLDRIPTPTHVVAPVFPPEWSERGIIGSVTVSFYIDESGRVRVPVVTATDHRLLGASAIAAVAQWKFEPPTRSGEPVLVQAEQVFSFPALTKAAK